MKDYITAPKPNGYQSLHSSLALGELTAELQIRTSEMHLYAGEVGEVATCHSAKSTSWFGEVHFTCLHLSI